MAYLINSFSMNTVKEFTNTHLTDKSADNLNL